MLTINDFRTALQETWVPGEKATRYGRTWRLTERQTSECGLWGGKIGYVKDASLSRLYWDSKQKDFHHEALSSGMAVPFLINVDRRVVSFQIRPPNVRVNSVTGALQAILNRGGLTRWRIEPIRDTSEYDAWRESVATVQKLEVRQLRAPNPRWGRRKQLRDLVKQTQAERATIIVQNNRNGLNEESLWYKELEEHVEEGYGRATLSGRDLKTGKRSKFVLGPESSILISQVYAETVNINYSILAESQRNIGNLQEKDDA